MTYRTKVSQRGQLVIPQAIRQNYGFPAGAIIEITVREPGVVELRATASLEERLAAIRELVRRKGKPPVTDQMIDAISARAAIERYRRSLV